VTPSVDVSLLYTYVPFLYIYICVSQKGRQAIKTLLKYDERRLTLSIYLSILSYICVLSLYIDISLTLNVDSCVRSPLEGTIWPRPTDPKADSILEVLCTHSLKKSRVYILDTTQTQNNVVWKECGGQNHNNHHHNSISTTIFDL